MIHRSKIGSILAVHTMITARDLQVTGPCPCASCQSLHVLSLVASVVLFAFFFFSFFDFAISDLVQIQEGVSPWIADPAPSLECDWSTGDNVQFWEAEERARVLHGSG